MGGQLDRQRWRSDTALVVRGFIQGLGALDLRALGLLRIGTGLLLVVDVLTRIGMVREHYSDAGFLPRSLWHAIHRDPAYWSLHLVSGDTWVQVALLMLTAVLGVALALGLRTRLCTIAAWALISSIQARNPDINHGGDAELRLILFWAIFLPWGRCYSFAASAGADSGAATSVRSMATLAYSVQIAIVYIVSAFLKSGPHWRENFTAVYYTLNIAGFARAPAGWIAQSPGLTSALTIATLIFEFVGPIALLLSGAHWRVRLVTLAGFVGLHLGFALCMHLGTFPIVCIVAMLAFLPAAFFDRVAPPIGGRLPRMRAAVLAASTRLRAWGSALPCWLFERAAEPRWARLPISFLVAACLGYVLLWNVGSVKGKKLVPDAAYPVARALGLPQHWGMFVNKNPASTWLVAVGHSSDGTQTDPLTGRPPRWEMPSDLPRFYGDFRTGRYMARLFIEHKRLQRHAYAQFICREWNARHPEARFESLEVFWAFQRTPPPGAPRPAPGRRSLIEVRCGP